MASVTFSIPDEVQSKLSNQHADINSTLRLEAAFSLCRRGELSTSLSAQLAGLSYSDFLEAAARAEVELYPVDFDDLTEEIQHGHTLGR